MVKTNTIKFTPQQRVTFISKNGCPGSWVQEIIYIDRSLPMTRELPGWIRYRLKEEVEIVYHGGDKLDDFDYNQIGSAKHGNVYGNGFYFTSEYDMAWDFAFKTGKDYGFIYKCLIQPKHPLVVTQQEINKLNFDYLIDNDNDDLFWKEISQKYDCLIITNRKFGGNMKFPNKYENFTEVVVYDKTIIKIIEKKKV